MAAIIVSLIAAFFVIGWVILGDRTRGTAEIPTMPGLIGLICGAVGFVVLAAAFIASWTLPDGGQSTNLLPYTIALGLIGLFGSAYALSRRDRSWRAWVGVVAGAVTTAFWVVFIAGEFISPH